MTNKPIKRTELYENLNMLEGLTLKEMIKVLHSYSNPDSLKAQLYKLKRQGLLIFNCKNNRFYHFKITDKKYLGEKEAEEGKTRLSQIKIKLYVEDVVNMRDIANNPAIKASERIKATEAKQKALKHLESAYALNLLKTYGLDPEDD